MESKRKVAGRGLVYAQRYDHSWYGPIGSGLHADARRIGGPIGRRQASGAVLYARRGSDDPETVAIWIPATLRPGGHEANVERWLDAEAVSR